MNVAKGVRALEAGAEGKGKAIPLWRSVQSALEREIDDGTLVPGQKLPTEEFLADRFKVHRHTIRRAIAKLQEKQLLRSEQGRGTFIVERGLNYRVGRDTRLTVSAVRSDRKPVRFVRSRKRVKADRMTAYHLSLPVGHPVQEVRFLRIVDDRTFASAVCFYPLPRFEGIGAAIEECGSITDAMLRYGISEFPRKSTSIRAVMATSEDARLLSVPRRSPLLELFNVNVDKSGVPVQLTKTRLNSALINLIFDF